MEAAIAEAEKPKTAAPVGGSSPTTAEVAAQLLRVARKFPRWAKVTPVLPTARGTPIYAVTITDDTTPDTDKQQVLIVAGQHGNEESPRLVALALIDWLLSPGGAKTRKKQKLVVMPNVNPDGADLDLHANPDGIQPNLDHNPGGPVSAEAQAVQKMFFALEPDVYVDMHARGAAGCSHDMVLFPGTQPYTQDENLNYQIAAEMCAAGEKAGLPQIMHPLTWPGWGGDGVSSTLFAYRQFKSIVMLTENSESNSHCYPREAIARSGVAKVRALLNWGNRRHSKLYWSGYPNQLVTQSFYCGLLAWGADAAERRKSRVALWRQREHFKMRLEYPEAPKHKKLCFEYDGPALQTGVAIQLTGAGRRRVRRVCLNGQALPASETHGYVQFASPSGTHVAVALNQLQPGGHELVVDFK